MSGLSIELYNRCRNVLLNCNEFDSHASLQTIFVTPELHPFRDSLPEAASKSGRVDACLGFLLFKRLSNGQAVFPLFLTALRGRYEVGDSLHNELETLRLEVEEGLVAQIDETWSSAEDHLISFLHSQDKRQFGTYILSRARLTTLPPIGVTSTAIINKVSAIIKGQDNVLNEVEAYVLLVAVCLPHLLRSHEDLVKETISTEHVRQLAKWLDQEVDVPDGIGSSLTEIVTEVSLIANARIEFNPESETYSPSYLYNERINLRLLGALLHLSNRLNLDQFVDPEPPQFLSQATEMERFHWWRQAFVRSVSIEEQRLQLHIRLPEGYQDLYEPILVAPLDEEIKELLDAYDPLLTQAGINLNLRPANVTGGVGIRAIPDEEWRRLREEIRIEQARKSQDRLQQDVIRAQSLWESLVKAEVNQAEQMIAEEKYLDGAEAFARSAALLARTGQAYQAKNYATQAAEYYLKGDNRLAAAQQYLQAAEVWLYHRNTPELAARQLEQAHKIAVQIDEKALQVRILHAQAWLAFATLRDQDAQRIWEQIKELIPQIEDEAQRIDLWRTSALQQATFAMVWEEWDTAREILETVLAAFPETALDERLDLLQGLLLVSTERGDWEIAGHAYQESQQLLGTKAESQRSGILAMHYGASLARRGALQEAYDSYSLAIQQLDGYADAYTLGLAYQNMQYMLLRNGAASFSGFEEHEARRIDLFYNAQTEYKGYAHERQAIAEFSAENYRGAMQHIRLALAHYWRKGDWGGIEHAYQILAKSNVAINKPKPVEALFAIVRAGDIKAVEQYAVPLRDTGNPEQLAEVIRVLIEGQPAACEQQVAAKALGILADVVPPRLLAQVLDHLLMLLQGPEDNDRHVAVRCHSAEALRHLVVQLTSEQTNRVVQVALDQLQRQQGWTVIRELLRLLDECFSQQQPQVGQSLYAPVAEALLNFSGNEYLRNLAGKVAVHLASTAPSDVRERVVDFLREQPEGFDNLIHRAFLKESISEDQLNDVIEQILHAINPQPVSSDQGIMITVGGILPRAINYFNEVIPSSLYDRVIDGLLEAIINENNHFNTRSNAIWALSDLPTEILVGRADEVADYLIWGEEGDTLPRSSFINLELESQVDPFSNFRMNTGNVAQVRQSSLWALGRLNTHLNADNQERVSAHLINASRDPDPVVRQGVAMALHSIEAPLVQPQRLLLSLVVLLHDPEPKPCSSACTASGHLIACGLTDPFTEDLFESLVYLAETSPFVEVRAGAAVGLRLIAESERLGEAMHRRALKTLEKLSDDVSFRVRRQASSYIEKQLSKN